MADTIIVTTDFTQSSANALEYAGNFIGDKSYKILLLHIYTMPATYTSDGVAMVSIRDAFDSAEAQLDSEIAGFIKLYPHVQIEMMAMVGGLMESLKELIRKVHPIMIIMGAADDYANLWMWDNELLNVLTGLPVPVLVVPKHVAHTAIKNIGFACDYRNLCVPGQVSFIKWIVNLTKSQLHVVHITREKPVSLDIKNKNEKSLQQVLAEVNPHYYELENPNVIDAISQFVMRYQLDILVVVPHRHGVWKSIFSQSHTRQLAKLNNLPIMALHD